MLSNEPVARDQPRAAIRACLRHDQAIEWIHRPLQIDRFMGNCGERKCAEPNTERFVERGVKYFRAHADLLSSEKIIELEEHHRRDKKIEENRGIERGNVSVELRDAHKLLSSLFHPRSNPAISLESDSTID
jgi:hypothetical protein